MVGAAGTLLERSIVDRMVGGAERLVFEGGPILEAPVQQDKKARRPVAVAGDLLDTLAICPPLTVVEKSEFAKLKAKEEQRLAPEVAAAREAFIERELNNFEKYGMSHDAARRAAERRADGLLPPETVLPFDDEEFAGCTVGDILADPERFLGATLADPLEGVGYGRCKAKVMRRDDGSIFINSFAHGGKVYDVKLSAASVRAEIEKAGRGAAKKLAELAPAADLDAGDLELLRNFAHELSGLTKRAVEKMVKEEGERQQAKRARQAVQRRAAERTDPRPLLPVPSSDAPWLPQMEILEDVLGSSKSSRPPMRNIDGASTMVLRRAIPAMHTFKDANVDDKTEDMSGKIPPPEQFVLVTLDEMEHAELIERHIEHYDPIFGVPVHLPMNFVRHHLQRHGSKLPTVAAVTTMPIVFYNGTVIAPDGLERSIGTVFEIQKELRAIIPTKEECTPAAAKKALKFLCEEWLCDVTADYKGKCITVALALTLIERLLLSDRPAFWVTAGRRGGGKTTLLMMLIMAVLGIKPSAAAWSTVEEERRKALLSYFLLGVPYILWDNIPSGAQIGCPHIERSCTSEFYSDRRLGVSEAVLTAAATIHLFTGNNVGPKGDLASRSLHIRLNVDRPDPENRLFKHPNPLDWTEKHRAEILCALYTILLANPELDKSLDASAKTRFKQWWRMVGSAVENAAAEPIDFKQLFLEQEEDDEDAAQLGDVLEVLYNEWKDEKFDAGGVATIMNGQSFMDGRAQTLREVLCSDLQGDVSPKVIGRRLKKRRDAPQFVGKLQLVLRTEMDTNTNTRLYWIEAKRLDGQPLEGRPVVKRRVSKKPL